MTNILVIGASRGIGLETVKRALAAGHRVRAFARSADKIAVDSPDVERFPGSALDLTDVTEALDGIEAVIQALGVTSRRELIFGTRLFSSATRILVGAMEARGPRRLVTVTGFGAGDSRGHGGVLYETVLFPLFLKRIYDDKDVQEMIIRRSRLDWTIVRPGMLTDGPATGSYHVLVDPADWRGGVITRADTADFLVREVEAGLHRGRTPVLVG